MTTHFQFRDLTLYGTAARHTYQFHPGVNLIIGPIGSGKTSLLELLKYTLGGDGILSPAVQESVVSTSVTAELGSQVLVFTRRLGASLVETYMSDGLPLGTYATTAGRTNAPISDVLLEALGIPALRIPRSRLRPTSASSRLSFFDTYAYLYLAQTEIDRSVVGHLDSYRDPKRRAAFELLYGLSNAALMDLQVQRGELRDALANRQRQASEIRNFLAAADQPALDAAHRERDRADAALQAAHAHLRTLQTEARAATPSADPMRERLAAVEEARSVAKEQMLQLASGCEALRSLAAQLELDYQRVGKSLAAETVLSGLDFIICPRCLQSLGPGRGEEGGCYLCLQPESPADARQMLEEEERRVEAQRQETLGLLREDEAQLDRARSRVEELDDEITKRRAELDDATTRYISPRFAEVQEAGAEAGRLEARLASLDSAIRIWNRFGAIEKDVHDTQMRLTGVEAQITETRGSLAAGLERVSTLSGLFSETLQQFKLPWLETAALDLGTYLPIVNGRSFEELSSGGMKTLVNDAYHFAALRYALVYADSLMPLLQIIDSPRKNLGSGPEDRALTENLYRRVRALQDAFGATFQMIVADNDAPALALQIPAIRLDYKNPGVPFAEHPGPEHVESIGGAAS